MIALIEILNLLCLFVTASLVNLFLYYGMKNLECLNLDRLNLDPGRGRYWVAVDQLEQLHRREISVPNYRILLGIGNGMNGASKHA